MTIVVKIGERVYELQSVQDLSKCREIYAHHTGDQNSLEDKFEQHSIDFVLDCS